MKLVCVIVVRRVKKNELLQVKSVELTTKLKLVWKKANVKCQILTQLTMLNVSKKAHLCHETIEKMVKML